MKEHSSSSQENSSRPSKRNYRKFASLAVLCFMGATTLLSFQNCTGSFSSSLSSVASSSLAHPLSARNVNGALGSASQMATDNYVEVRSQPNQYFYNYAPDVIYFNGNYHMYWCAGVGAAGDYVLHAQSNVSSGPFHASNSAANFSYDVAISPTWNSANFDGYEACDPSVMQVGGTFYLYYGGLATQSNSTATTKIGVATSSDGVHFARANGGNPIVAPISFGGYGAGQPAVFFIAPYYYMSFTDSTGPGGNGQYMLRALDPLFQSGEQELIGPGNWANRSPLSRSGQYSWLGAFSIDIAYDTLSGKLFVPSDQEEGITRLYIVDPTSFQNLGYLSINGTWADGASIAKNPDRTMLNRASCSSGIDINLFKGDSPSGNYTTVPLGTDWNISRSEAMIQLSASICSSPAAAAPAPAAPAQGSSSQAPKWFSTFQANTSSAYISGGAGSGPLNLGMMGGTSPSATALSGNGYEIAFQANTGNLWVTGSSGTGDQNLGMMTGTSPSIAALAGGGYEIAFQANTGHLWVTGSAGTADLNLGMMPGTSPSIAALPGGGYVVAFQANTGNLWVTGSIGTGDQHLGMMGGTSPSIAALPGGGYEAAFQANTGNLWVTGSIGTGDQHLGMMGGTSPSIAALPGGGYEAAFQANTGNLWVTGSLGTGDQNLGMMGGTSPSIAALPGGGYEAAFQANTGNLWVTGSLGTGDQNLGMMGGTSPSILLLHP